MTIRHYRIFLGVLHRLNMTSAASDLHLTQPAVSQAIAEMEDHYGLQLFVRSSKGLKVTEAALNLREYVDALLAIEDNIEKCVWVRLDRPDVNIGLDTAAWNLFMPQLQEEYEKECGECNLIFHTIPSGAMVHAVAAYEMDFAIVAGSILPETALKCHKLAEDRLVFVCKKGSRHVTAEDGASIEVGARELTKWPMLLPYKSSAARAAFNASMMRYNLEYTVKGNFDSRELLLDAVLNDLGIGLISSYAVYDREKLSAFSVNGLDLQCDINLVYSNNSVRTPQTEQLESFIISHCSASGMSEQPKPEGE